MTRILLIETASPKRVREKAEQILTAQNYPNPEIWILCQESNSKLYSYLPGIHLINLDDRTAIRSGPFDAIYEFWTGEKRYRRWKTLSLRMKAKERYIIAGDGNEFRLTWKAICRHSLFRLKHPLPSDHRDYVDQDAQERILVLQTAEPICILKAMERIRENRIFSNPLYTIFCRNLPEMTESFRDIHLLDQVLTHSETRGSWKHLRFLRRQRFDAIVLFLTGNPSYWKMKLFAFLLGTRRILIFNEFNQCFFFNISQWIALLCYRMHDGQSYLSQSWGNPIAPRWMQILFPFMLKSVTLPFRFVWLLLVWLRLRIAGLIWSRNSHDYPL